MCLNHLQSTKIFEAMPGLLLHWGVMQYAVIPNGPLGALANRTVSWELFLKVSIWLPVQKCSIFFKKTVEQELTMYAVLILYMLSNAMQWLLVDLNGSSKGNCADFLHYKGQNIHYKKGRISASVPFLKLWIETAERVNLVWDCCWRTFIYCPYHASPDPPCLFNQEENPPLVPMGASLPRQ